MINSKSKGKRFEREIAQKFRDYGYSEAHRTAQFKGNTGQADDVEGVPYIHIECKHQERMELYKWYDQAVRDSEASKDGKIPTVIHKANNKPVLVTMAFDDWMQMFNEYVSGRDIDGRETNVLKEDNRE